MMKHLLSRLYKTKKPLLVSVAAIVGLAGFASALLVPQSASTAQRGGNTHINEYMQANWNAELARGIPYPARTGLKVLKGSWYEMGQQYGQSFGKYVRIVYDANYGLFLSSQLDPAKLGPILDLYMNETKKLSPEMVEFVRGIGNGAAPELNGADHATALTNTQKIMLINCLFEVVLPSAWPHVAQLMGVEPPDANVQWEPFASHSWAAWGDMTRGHDGIMGGTRDQPWFPTMYNVSYVAVPSDRRAAVTWTNSIAGMVVASAQVNEHGVGTANTIVSHKQQYFGVPALLSTAYIAFFAHSAREAADIYTIGTPEYRQKTGRQTLASTVGFFQTFADAKEGLVVERTGRHYAVRTTGDQNERGDYVVLPNHALAPDSYDESGNLTGKPMVDWTIPSGPTSSTQSRYWALFHEFDKQIGQHNKAKVDPKFARETIATMKHSYTPDGQLITEKDGIPIWRLGLTPERWLIPNPADPNSLPTGGNNMYFVADLKKGDINWVQGIPSHWKGPWDHVSLRDPAWQCLRQDPKKSCGAPTN